MQENIKNQTVTGFIWRLAQNVSGQFISFFISIVLARILMPEDYEAVTIIMIFLSIANVFIDTGFSSAIIQKKEVDQAAFSSSFYVGIGLSSLFYILLFFLAPTISDYYEMPLLTEMLRVQALSIVLSSFKSVHQTIVTKQMQFQKTLVASVISSIAHGIAGIAFALTGFGAWSLIFSRLIGDVVSCICLWILVKWHPNTRFSWRSISGLATFSIKVLLLNLINELYNNLRSLIIGKEYDSSSLVYYNRGYNFAAILMSSVSGAMTTVMFPSLSKLQDDPDAFMNALRKSTRLSLYVCAPLMFGMMAVAEPMILTILTDKWLEAVPFLQISCLICLTWLFTISTQGLIAKGKSSVALFLNIISKAIGLLCIIVAIRFDVFTFVFSGLISGLVIRIIDAFIYKKELNYSFRNQIFDIISPMWRAVIMAALIYPVNFIALPALLKLFIMIPGGIVIYVLLSFFPRSPEFTTAFSLVKTKFFARKGDVL